MSATLTCCKLTTPDIKPLEYPFPELINPGSNHVLPPPQRDIILGSISSALQDASQLEQGISHLERKISELRTEREARLAFAIAHKALVSPLYRTPPEIFTEIFLHCVKENLNLEHPTTPILLASICSRWRSIVLSSPQLWAYLHFVIRLGRDMEPQTALATLWLSRAGKHPLSIRLESTNSMGCNAFQNVQSLMDIFLARCEQWQTLKLALPDELIRCLLGATNRLPRLEKLAVGDENDWETISPDISTIFATAPRLRSLELLNMYRAPRLPWHQLHELILDEVLSVERCLNILAATSSIQKCKFVITYAGAQNIHAASSITLPWLRCMSIAFRTDEEEDGGNAEEDLPYFLSAICLPAIQELSISASDPPSTAPEFSSAIADALVAMLSHGSLLKLTLGLPPRTHITPASTMSILRATPKLLYLSLWDDTALILCQEFVDHFNASDACLVPSLQQLDFGCSDELVMSIMLDMVEGRCLPNRQTPLKQVSLNWWYRDHYPDAALKSRLRLIKDAGLDVQLIWPDNTTLTNFA